MTPVFQPLRIVRQDPEAAGPVRTRSYERYPHERSPNALFAGLIASSARFFQFDKSVGPIRHARVPVAKARLRLPDANSCQARNIGIPLICRLAPTPRES